MTTAAGHGRRPLRVAVVGLGEAGATLHLPALTAVPEVQVVGACDPDAGRRDATFRRWGIPVFGDVTSLLSSARPEVVSVATPPDSHMAICLAAIAAGADVFCEKPFVASVAEADRVIEAAAAAGRAVAVNHEFREMPIFRAVIDAVRSGRDGDLRFAQVWQQVDLPPWGEYGWRGALVRRSLFEAGVHLLDILIALFDELPGAVRACTSSAGLDAANRDALVVATLEFSRGRIAILTQNRLTKGEPQYLEARADVSQAAYRASFGGRARLSAGFFRSSRPHLRFEYGTAGIAWRETGTRRRRLARNPSSPNAYATGRLLKQALAAFRAGDAPPSSASDARRLMAVVEACYASAESGQRVRLG